jgi:hypothetical protein
MLAESELGGRRHEIGMDKPNRVGTPALGGFRARRTDVCSRCVYCDGT